ncbi:MAG: autotransporter-associated beta strand repeat-containing protein, partial [Planctomycetota bacterium]|nr:autotransporter-associated beta strand repeat-containing protein [Planctomycetota bacterium]
MLCTKRRNTVKRSARRVQRQRRLWLETLESRQLLASSSSATWDVSSGNLTVTDTVGTDNQLTVSVVAGNLVITDANAAFVNPPGIGELSNSDKTLTIPLGDVTGQLIVYGNGGDDSLTVDFGVVNPIPIGGLTFHGVAGVDTLTVQGDTGFAALTYDATGIGAGTLQFSDVPLITFDGLEPVVVNPVSGTITINIDPLITVPGLLTSTFTSPGPSLDNQVAFSPGGLESLEFNNPTNALIVNGRPNADDTITFASLHAGFNAALTVDGQGGTDTVSLNTGDNVGCAVSIVSPSTINLGPSTIAGALTVTASGDISISGTVRSSSVTLITTSGAIKDNNNSNPDIWATDAVLTAVNGIGAGSIGAGSDTTDTTTNPLNYLDTRVSRLDVNNNVYNIPTADGQVQIANDGALQLIDLDATKAMIINGLNPGTIRANSPETISTSITHNTSFTYMAGDDVIAIDDNLTINNDATVTLDSYSATLTFQAGDDILFGDATTTPTTTGQINTVKLGCSVSLTADHDGGTDPPVTDGYSGGVFQAATQTVASVTTTDLIITAGGGVGLPADLSVSPSLPPVPLGISVGTLDVENTTSGDILISQNTTGSLSVARLKNEAPGGWIQLWASGSTTVEGDPGVSGVSTNGGGVLLAMSSGENPSLAVNAPITTNGGSVDLEADGSVTSTIDGVITTTVQGTSGGNSGDVTVIASLGTQEILDLAGDIDTHGASNTTGVGGNGGSLGFSPAVYIRNISGAVIVSGLITTTGGSGTPTGGNGGEVALFTDSGSISVNEPALITTSGGWGSTTGGDAGGIYVNVYGEGYAATVSVPLTAVGGQAGTGDGGTGGHVQVTAADGSVTVSTITASGGDSTSGTGGSAYGWQLMPGAFQEAVSLTTAGNLGDVTIKGTVTALGGNWGQSLQGNDGEVYVSAAGGLVDGLATPDLLDVWAGRLTANATTGVGLANPLDTQVTTLNVTNSIFGFGSGNIDINEFDAVDVFQLTNDVDVDQLTGSIRLVAGGTITLLTKANPPLPLYTPPYPTYQASGVQATDGNVTLTAGVTAGVNADGVLNNVVTLKARTSTTTSTAAVTISAERDVLGDAAGDITTADGNVTITADADGSGLGGNNDGTIQLRGDITALGGSVTLSLADCDGWLGDATVVADDGRILSALDITKNGLGALRLNRAGNTYTGLTTVNDGTLIVNGTLFDSVAAGGVVVTDNAILGGNGTINAVVLVKAFGTLDPGDCLANGAAPRCSPQPGKLTVTSVPPEDGSTVQFEFDATFRVQLNGLIPGQATSGPPVDGGYDQLVVDGTVNLGGTTPPGANGATLQTSVGVGFVMPVGAAFRVINNDSTELVSNQFNDLPEESFFYAGSYVMNISYQSGLNNNDVTLTHPGRYDFNAYLPDTDPYYYESVGPMYPGNTAQAYSESTGVGWSTTSPNVLPQVTGRGASEGDSLGRNTYPVGASPSGTPVRLLRDLHFTY